MLPTELQFPHPAITVLIDSVPPRLTLGESRLYVSDSELLEASKSLAAIEETKRTTVLLECKRIYFQCSDLQHSVQATIPAESQSPAAGQK